MSTHQISERINYACKMAIEQWGTGSSYQIKNSKLEQYQDNLLKFMINKICRLLGIPFIIYVFMKFDSCSFHLYYFQMCILHGGFVCVCDKFIFYVLFTSSHKFHFCTPIPLLNAALNENFIQIEKNNFIFTFALSSLFAFKHFTKIWEKFFSLKLFSCDLLRESMGSKFWIQ